MDMFVINKKEGFQELLKDSSRENVVLVDLSRMHESFDEDDATNGNVIVLNTCLNKWKWQMNFAYFGKLLVIDIEFHKKEL